MIKTKAISLTLLLLIASVSFADELCPGSEKLPAPSGAEELKMYEKDFTLKQAAESVAFLEKDVIKMIKTHKGPHSILDFEGFYIGYPNNITFVKGTLLKQEALIKKNNLELLKMKLKNKESSKEEISKAEKEYISAKKKFCDFLKKAEYVD